MFSLILFVVARVLVPPPSHTHAIVQRDKQFSESELHIAVGDTVTFVNKDVVTHNVFSSSDGFRFNLKRQPPGAAAAVPFATKGKAEIRCAFHPTMRLIVVVE